ncbi:20405_t:CDS:2 [Gigaspora margarita]|uniref:DNA-directed RNA polymerase n=1 Tax=Gigaspora margarita TaxID=4874 RepID=A0ABN7W143_GIGMA|nr:20405_t:CDS:2 [Gigaspora margarita]
MDEIAGRTVRQENIYQNATEECWAVISAFFEYRGIVRQQLASYDHFVDYDVHDVVEANSEVILQHVEDRTDLEAQIRRIRINFSNPAVSVATHTEADGSVNRIWPHEARLRNLTYSCPVYVDVSCGTTVVPWTEAASSTFHELCDENETIFTQTAFIGKAHINKS